MQADLAGTIFVTVLQGEVGLIVLLPLLLESGKNRMFASSSWPGRLTSPQTFPDPHYMSTEGFFTLSQSKLSPLYYSYSPISFISYLSLIPPGVELYISQGAGTFFGFITLLTLFSALFICVDHLIQADGIHEEAVVY